MTGTTLLLRQIHPVFVQNGHPTSQAFRPTPKDQSKLSVYDGDMIQAEASWIHYTIALQLSSVGTMAIAVDECTAEGLSATNDPDPFPEHAIVDFTGLADKECYKKSKKIQAKAISRGWLYQATTAN